MKQALILIAVLALTGCGTLPRKSNETLSRGVYAAADSMDARRVDLADRYIHEIKKLVPPPKKRINIQPIDQ
jgi:uncharacterized protein YceK